MASDSVTEEYCSLDTLKRLKSLIYNLDGIRFDAGKISISIQECDDAPWGINYLVSKCMACLMTARGYLVNAGDICHADLAKQSDTADK